jgi:hypothetical protein
VWHPYWHSILLEGGFDRHDTFFFIPLGGTAALLEIWRRRVVALFFEKGFSGSTRRSRGRSSHTTCRHSVSDRRRVCLLFHLTD